MTSSNLKSAQTDTIFTSLNGPLNVVHTEKLANTCAPSHLTLLTLYPSSHLILIPHPPHSSPHPFSHLTLLTHPHPLLTIIIIIIVPAWTSDLGFSARIHSHKVGLGRGDNLEHVWGCEGVGLGIRHGVHSQYVRQLYLFVVGSGVVRFVHGETFSVQPPVELLTLGGGWVRGRMR